MALNIKTKQVGLDESIQDAVNRINRRGLNVKIRASDFTQPLGRITQKADEFTKSLEASNARVIAFGASAAIIGGVTVAFRELVVQSVKVEKILTDINVVLNTSLTNLQKFGNDLFKVARNTSQSLEVAAEAALEFSRQGLSMEETLRRTNDALILTRLTGIKAADAVSGLTAAVNGFADAGLSTTNIINKLAAVDVKFAVSADDLIDALARAGAVAQDAGVNFDQLVGAVTSAQQITARGGAVIGNSFKTIFTRIQRSSTLDRLEELGVAVRDIRGQTLPALTVLQGLAKSYDKLGASTKAAVAEQVGGVFQINVLKAALKDLNRENSLYAQATQISAQATDQAQQKNAQLQQTISSLATQTSLTIQELSKNIGDLALAPGISNVLEAINSLAGGLNDLFGKNSEGVGADFAKGLVRGIGNVLTGPGLVLAFGVFGKLFTNALKFAKSSLKDILGIVDAKTKEKQIQQSIVEALQNNKMLAQDLESLAGNKTAQEEYILQLIEKQTQAMQAQQNIAKSLGPGLIAKGVDPTTLTKKSPTKRASSGLVPESDASAEKDGARRSGYVPGNVKSMKIKGFGDVIYNDAESVRYFGGLSQPAIMPPKGSRAGDKYRSSFIDKHGFNPYSSLGFIPNFAFGAKKINDTLTLPKAKMFIQSSDNKYAKGGWHNITTTLNALKTEKGGKELLAQFMALETLGIKRISRPFYFTKSGDPQGKIAKSASRKQRKLTGGDRSRIPGDMYEDAVGKNLSKKGYIQTPGNANVDYVRKGGTPIEAKFNDAKSHSLIAKSLKLTTDKYIESFLSANGMAAFSDSMRDLKKNLALNTAESIWGSSGSSNIQQFRMNNGFVPNFRTRSTMKQNLQAGRNYEQFVGKVFGKSPTYNSPMDFYGPLGYSPSYAQYIGGESSPLHISRGSLGYDFLDAHSGAGHSPGQLFKKFLNANIINQSDIDDFNGLGLTSEKGKAIDLTDVFTEISRKGNPGVNKRTHKGIPFLFKRDVFNPKHSGFIPNFANALQESIDREMAAGIPKSMIRVGQDDSLVSASNPMGLGVMNTRDEPLGLKQGIRRSKRLGVDPRTHGANGGLIPNFQKSDSLGVGKLFGLTSLAYAIDGVASSLDFLGEEGKKTAQAFTGITQGATQGLLVASAFKEIGQNSKGVLGFLGKMGPLAAVVSAAIPIFSALKENTTLLDSRLDSFNKSIDKNIKGIDALSTSISLSGDLESTRSELIELNNSAMAQSFDGEMKRLQLESRIITQQSELSKSAESLAKNLNLTEEELTLMTSGTSEGMKKLQESMLNLQNNMAIDQAMKSFSSATQGDSQKSFWQKLTTPETKRDPLTAQLQEKTLASITARSLSTPESIESNYNQLNTLLSKPLGEEMKYRNRMSSASGGKIKPENIIIPPELAAFDREGNEEQFLKSVAESDLNDVLKRQISSAIKTGSSMMDIQKLMERQKDYVVKLNQETNQNAQETEDARSILQDIKKQRMRILNEIEIAKIDYSVEQNLQKINQDHMMQEMEYRAKLNESLNVMTKDGFVNLQLQKEEAKIQNDYLNKKAEVNREAIEKQQNLIKELFIGGGNFKPEEMFSSLSRSFSTTIAKAPLTNDSDAFGGAYYAGGHDLMLGAKSSVPNMESITYTGNSPEAFQGNLAELRKKLEDASMQELSIQLQNVENSDRARNIAFKYVKNLGSIEEKSSALLKMQDLGIIPANANIEQILNHIADVESSKLDGLTKEQKAKIKGLELAKKQLELNAGTVGALKEQLDTLRNTPHSKFDAKISERLQTNKLLADIEYVHLKNAQIYTRDGQGLLELQAEQKSIEQTRVMKEYDSMHIAEQRLAAEEELRKSMHEYKSIIAKKVSNEIKTMGFSADDDTTLLEEQKKQKYFAIKADTDYTLAQNAATRAQLEFTANLEKGRFQFDAMEEMAQASRDFTETMVKVKTKLAENFFFEEGQRSVEQQRTTRQSEMQRLEGQRAGYMAQGADIKVAETDLEIARKQKEMNIELGRESLFRDTITERIKENNLALSRFGETLANTTFDSVQSGFEDLFKNITDGTMSMGDALKNFAGGIAQAIGDALMQRATKQITTGIFQAIGYSRGGLAGYASGGSVGGSSQVPAMLTNGEYVVKKKIVDRLGINTFDKINKSGSLEDLYNQPNEEMFDISTEGAAQMPMFTQMSSSDLLGKHLLNSKSNSPSSTILESGGGFGSDQISAFDQIVNKFNGGVVSLIKHFDGGGSVTNEHYEMKTALKSKGEKSALQNIAEGSGTVFGAYLAKKGKQTSMTDAPTAPERYQRLNLASSLDINPESNMMSARYKANDKYRKEYGQYLLDKYQYDVDQKNQKVQNRANQWGALAQGLTATFAARGITGQLNRMSEGMKAGMSLGEYSKTLEQLPGDHQAWKDAGKPAGRTKGRMDYLTPKVGILGTSNKKDFSGSGAISGGKTSISNSNLTQSEQFTSWQLSNQNSHQFSSNMQDLYDNVYKYHGGIISSSAVNNAHARNISSTANFNKGGSVNSSHYSNFSPYSYFNRGGSVRSSFINNPYSYYNKGGSVRSSFHNNPYSYFNRGGSVYSNNQNSQSMFNNMSNPYSFNSNSSNNENNILYSSNSTENPYSYFNRGGSVSYNNSFRSQNNMSYMSNGGKVFGPGGIDKVGPVMLDKGEYVIKASSVQSVEKKYPGFFDRLNTMKMNQGGVVSNTNNPISNISNTENSPSSSNNVTININVASDGTSTSSGGEGMNEQQMAARIKDAVVGIINQEKRIGGSLRGK